MANTPVCKINDCGKPLKARGYCEYHYRRDLRYGDPVSGNRKAGSALRWARTAAVYDGEGCLIWPFHRHRATGYGRMTWSGKPAIASRVICELAHGVPPTPRHYAAHSCGNAHEGCVNPRHLRWATAKENQADRRLHGTHLAGEQVGNAKLTEADVREIRRLAAGGEVHMVIAGRFGISASNVSLIRNRKAWGHLAGGE